LAPFLRFDADPYPVLHEGRIVYLVDGYTTTNRFPNSQQASVGGLSSDSGLRTGFNYVRNSVKAVVDAFDGGVTFYVADSDDPIIQVYESAFGSLFRPISEMPDDLVGHLRYAEDLFRVQTEMWGAYHVEDTENFYQRAAEWAVSQDPGRTGEGALNLVVVNEQGMKVGTRDMRMAPYRTMLDLPGSDETEFVIIRAYVPLDEEDARKELAAYIVGRSDGDHYGELVLYRPPTSNFDGPALSEERIRNDEEVATLQTLLSQRGSTVLFGELLLVPIENSVLYVRPLYVQAEGDNTVPELERVIVAVGEDVVMADSLEEALEQLTDADMSSLFGTVAASPSGDGTGDGSGDGTGDGSDPGPVDVSDTVADIVAELGQLQVDAAKALAEDPPDWIEWGQIQARAQQLLDALVAASSS
jgi:hypothetical protein